MASFPQLLPDVGATAFLNACPGRTGLYLGLTGARLDTADAIYAGFGTHHVASDKHPVLLDALINADYAGDRFAAVDAVLERYSSPAGDSKLEALQRDIDRLFAADDMETIVAALQEDGSDVAKQALDAFRNGNRRRWRRSRRPTSTNISNRWATRNSSLTDT